MKDYQGKSTLEVLEKAKNYNSWIASNFTKQITYPLLEIGAGTGNLSEYFLKINNSICLSDNDTKLLARLENKYNHSKNVSIKKLDITQGSPSNMKNKFASVLAINVLEHIKKDRKALINIKDLLQPNGKLLLLTPAKQFAYTKLDKELGHWRRYERKELIDKVTSAGYIIDHVYFFNFVGLISWMVRSLVEKESQQINPRHVRLFDSIVPTLRVFESFCRTPIGISLIVIARKA